MNKERISRLRYDKKFYVIMSILLFSFTILAQTIISFQIIEILSQPVMVKDTTYAYNFNYTVLMRDGTLKNSTTSSVSIEYFLHFDRNIQSVNVPIPIKSSVDNLFFLPYRVKGENIITNAVITLSYVNNTTFSTVEFSKIDTSNVYISFLSPENVSDLIVRVKFSLSFHAEYSVLYSNHVRLISGYLLTNFYPVYNFSFTLQGNANSQLFGLKCYTLFYIDDVMYAPSFKIENSKFLISLFVPYVGQSKYMLIHYTYADHPFYLISHHSHIFVPIFAIIFATIESLVWIYSGMSKKSIRRERTRGIHLFFKDFIFYATIAYLLLLFSEQVPLGYITVLLISFSLYPGFLIAFYLCYVITLLPFISLIKVIIKKRVVGIPISSKMIVLWIKKDNILKIIFIMFLFNAYKIWEYINIKYGTHVLWETCTYITHPYFLFYLLTVHYFLGSLLGLRMLTLGEVESKIYDYLSFKQGESYQYINSYELEILKSDFSRNYGFDKNLIYNCVSILEELNIALLLEDSVALIKDISLFTIDFGNLLKSKRKRQKIKHHKMALAKFKQEFAKQNHFR